MPVEIKRVAYCWNSALESQGEPSYFLDVLVSVDRTTLVDRHESYRSREEFLAAIEGLIPVIEAVDPPAPTPPLPYDILSDPRAAH